MSDVGKQKQYKGVLRDCPFCGAAAVLYEDGREEVLQSFRNTEKQPVFFGMCTGCGIRTHTQYTGWVISLPASSDQRKYVDTEEAKRIIISRWNRRV